MNRNTGHRNAALRRRVGADAVAESQVCSGRSTRRQLLIALGVSALAAPFAAFAQSRPARMPRMGFLTGGSAAAVAVRLDALRAGLRELGHEEGKTIAIEYRFAEGQYDRLRGLAEALVKSGVDVLVTGGTPATRAAQQATTTVPIVMSGVGDPVASGFVASLARPGGNITGTTNISPEIGAKRLDLMITTVPKLARVAVLLNAANPTRDTNFNVVLIAAQPRGVQVVRVEARTPQDIEQAFANMKRQRVNAFIVQTDQFFLEQRAQIIDLAARERLPAIYGDAEFTAAGGLMSYGTNVPRLYRRAAIYVDKILKGAKPGELPVEQPMQFELVFNNKTAKALGIKIPQSILISADKVIE